MSPRNNRAAKVLSVVLICLALIFAGGLVVGFATSASLAFIRVFEFIGAVGIPLSGAIFLAWFAYKLLLEPITRKRKLDRLREYRARRMANLDPNERS